MFRIPSLDRIVQTAAEHSFWTPRTGKRINPYPVLFEDTVAMSNIRVGHILSVNPRYRPADKRKPIWRHREYRWRLRARAYLTRYSNFLDDYLP